MLYREIMAVCSEIYTKHINIAVWAERRIFRRLHKISEKTNSFVMSVCPSTYNSAPTGRIYTKFDIYFSKNLQRKFKFR